MKGYEKSSAVADGARVSSPNFRHAQLLEVLINSLVQVSQDTLNPAIDQRLAQLKLSFNVWYK